MGPIHSPGRSASTILVVLLLATVALLGAVTSAEATTITSWKGIQPAGNVGSNIPVTISGSGVYSQSSLVASSVKMFIDGVTVPRSSYTASVLSASVYFYYGQPMLTDGPHTFRVEVSDGQGRLSYRQWTATVLQPPTASWVSPTAGATDRTGRPQIVMTLADNTPGTTFTVTGQVRSGTAGGPVVTTFGGAGLAAGQNSFTLPTELPPGIYYLTATVTDAAGNSKTLLGPAARGFATVAAEAMSVLTDCDDCHAPYQEAHPTTNECMACHPGYDGDHMEGTDYCEDCHWEGWHNGGAGEQVAVTSACTACHGVERPEVVQHTSASVTASHAGSCGGCHVTSLITQHAYTPAGSAYASQCDLCHASTDPAVAAAIVAGDSTCDRCHDGSHGDIAAKHASPTTSNCFGAGCHDASKDLPTVHASYAGTGTEYGYDTTCDLCHANRDPDRIDWDLADARCTGACHSGTTHSQYNAKHAVSAASAACTGCHGTNLADVHKAGSDFAKCATCHARVSNWSETAECASCHDTASPHGDVAATHGAALGPAQVTVFQWHAEVEVGPSNTTMDCRLCHSSDLTKLHDDCWTCHADGAPRDSFTTWNGSCQQGSCHATYHDGSGAVHNSVGGGCDCHDANWYVTPTGCRGCHGFVDEQAPVTTSNARAEYGGVAKITLTATDNQYGTGVAHTYYRIDGGTQTSGTVVTVPGPAVGTVTHSVQFWSVDTAGNAEAPHTVTFSLTTDAVAPTTTSDAEAAYVGGAIIHLTPSDPAPSSDVDHTYYRLDGGAQQEGTTIPVYTGGAHTLEFWSVDGAGNDEAHTTVDFTIELDDVAPVTTSNAPAFAYAGQPFIDFSASDTGGSGVAHTYWRIDGGAIQESLRTQVYQLGWHTIEFWSVDWAGNEEQHKTATFLVDFIRPTVTTDVQPTYSGTAVIHITAEDNAGGSGIDSIIHRLDQGTAVAGDTVTVTTPGAHRLFYWVRDKAGCEEFGYVEFTVTP